MEKIFVIDAVNFLFRSYFAISGMTSPQGESTNALFGFIRSVLKIIKDFHPQHLVAVFDGPDNKRSRKAIYSQYKGHRKEMPQDLFDQIDKAKTFCHLYGIPLLCIEGVEADDTMGTIARLAEKNQTHAFLCSSDKDLCQLISPLISVINPHKDNLLMGEKEVIEHFGVRPDQIIDYLSIVGDSSDNIPGIEGFGPKTAAELLGSYGTLEHILSHPEVVSGKKREALVQQRDIALMSKTLATIQTDVAIPQEESFYTLCKTDCEGLREFYKQMHFLSLLKEMGMPKSDEQGEYRLVDTEDKLLSLTQWLTTQKVICIALAATSSDTQHATVAGIALGVKKNEAWYIPFNHPILGKEVVQQLIGELLTNDSLVFFGHNIKHDMHLLCRASLPIPCLCFDTMIASYVISPHTPRHSLEHLCLEIFGKVKIPMEDLIGKGKKQLSMLDIPLDVACHYFCEGVDYTIRLKEHFEEKLKDGDLHSVFYDIEMPLIPVLFSMEKEGIYLDKAVLGTMSYELKGKIDTLQEQIFAIAGEEFNLNSPKQLAAQLFDKMGLHPPKKTQTGYSTSADVLESLKDQSPIIPLILEYRTLEKLRSTYVDALPLAVHEATARIHCTFSQSTAATGRLSCQDPNLQNIPVKTDEGRKIRSAFRPQNAGWVFVSADYSQIELRLLAHLSKDPSLIEAFCRGEDIHTFTAAQVFNTELQEVSASMRSRAKAVNFGIVYGQQAFGLAQELGISVKEASAFIATYFERYSKVKEYLEGSKALAHRHGFAETITGRRRPIPDIDNKNPMIRMGAERLAINTPLQGTAADLIKIAMIQIHAALQGSPLKAKMLLQIHDELIFEVWQGDIEPLSALVKNIMENVFTLSIPLVVDISVGNNWGEC